MKKNKKKVYGRRTKKNKMLKHLPSRINFTKEFLKEVEERITK